MRLPRVYPILDTESLERRGITLEAAAAAFLEGGAGILQIRHKGHWSRAVFEAARAVARLCAEGGTPLIIDDRADFALLLDAGLHVGQDDLAPRDARRLLGRERTIGFSTHSAPQLAAAGGEPVDYVALGPVFGTASKRHPDPAIGGITRENARQVWEAGADSVAVIADLLPGPEEAASAGFLRRRMEEWQRLLPAA